METAYIAYLHSPWSGVLLDKQIDFHVVKTFPSFNWTRRFITAFTSARHLSLSWASSIQSTSPTSHFLKIHLIIILPSTPGSPNWTFFFRFPHQNPVYSSPLPSPMRATCPACLILLDFDGGFTTIQKSVTTEEAPPFWFTPPHCRHPLPPPLPNCIIRFISPVFCHTFVSVILQVCFSRGDVFIYVARGRILVPCLRPAIDNRNLFVHVSQGFAVLDNASQYRHYSWLRSDSMQYAVDVASLVLPSVCREIFLF